MATRRSPTRRGSTCSAEPLARIGNISVSAWQITLLATAVLLFWTVGAYNRLVRLRNTILRRFVPADEQFALRQTLLGQLADALAPLPSAAPQQLDALRAACAQADAARARVRVRPGASGAATSLRLAEDILADTRERVAAQLTNNAAMSELNAQLAASDATLGFARRQFNDAVQEYNDAVQQFPTWLIANLFSFRAAGAI
jgi:LemA protein